MASQDMVGVYDPGSDLTAVPSADVIGRRCVSISAARSTTPSGNVKVATTAAQARCHGVAKFSALANTSVVVARGNSRVVQIDATAVALAAGVDVEVGANGMVQLVTTGKPVGYTIDACLASGIAQVSLY
jgi:hypothetical protein